MHHFALVLVDPETSDVETDVHDIMMTYQEDNDTQTGWFDYYLIGGGWDHISPDGPALVRDLPEARPHTIVWDSGAAHRTYWDGPDFDHGDFVEDENWDRTAATILLANRDMLAVVVDYHS